MTRFLAISFLLPLLLVGQACTKTAPPAPPVSTSIFYLVEADRRCDWFAHNVDSGEKVAFYATSQCPTAVVWDTQSRRTSYVEGGEIYSVGWGADSPARKLGEVVDANTEYRLIVDGGATRVASLMEVEEKNVLTRQKAGEDVEVYVYDGLEFEAKGLVSWGERYVAAIHTYENERPRLIDGRATKSDAGGTQGLDILGDALRSGSGTISLLELLNSYTQYFRDSGDDAIPDNMIEEMSDPERNQILALLGFDGAWENLESEGPYYMSLAPGHGLLVRSESADTSHFVPPAYFCSARCTEHKQLVLPELYQLGIKTQAGYLLVAGEYDNANASLFRLGERQPILNLTNALYVVFEPFDGFWEVFSHTTTEIGEIQ